MKLLCVADTVVDKLLDPSFTPAEALSAIIACGDLPPEYLTSLRNRFDLPLYYVLGNHDLRYAQSPPQGCQDINCQLITHEGLAMVGFSGSRWYNGGSNQLPEKEMARNVKKMRFSFWRNKAPHLVVTHAPPRFIHDQEDPCHKGFRIFRWLIDKYQPRVFLHGHIHALFTDDAQRVTQLGETRVINCYGYYVLEI